MMHTYYLLGFVIFSCFVSDVLCKLLYRLEPHLSQSKILNFSKTHIHPSVENDQDSEDTNQQSSTYEPGEEVNDDQQGQTEEHNNLENETENRKYNPEPSNQFDNYKEPKESPYDHSSARTENVDINQHTKKGDNDSNNKIVDDINKDEQIHNMHQDAGDMIKKADETKTMAEDIKNSYKNATTNESGDNPHTHTDSHSIPKVPGTMYLRDVMYCIGEGNIVITNNTTTIPKDNDKEEKVDPMKSIISATRSLYERGRQKNLPISEPDDLSTPEQVYAALNALEYIIDGYCHSKIDIKDESPKDDAENTAEENSENPVGDDATEPSRFMQSSHLGNDEDEEDDEYGEGEEEEEKGEDTVNKESSHELNPHKAAEQIKGVSLKLYLTVIN
ncbi:hypothetical protein BEWA_033430 [Theileria equi strain WA]|uniref:Signal peptide-containing protein n=1 Tax=Theileria equi strain WA TaxID=1537102 RepID=L0AY55_THEEQ|nr:hypothetical protein BEWA_033430 [Theileria equi strain WA]AFZ80490.1 hypothetical protein BEWA_033430 [Theileria equi strain WA]|eukprot:XP_004830156.1 hypothetical protein BEWA_033430 [Theileria equi strain WA]